MRKPVRSHLLLHRLDMLHSPHKAFEVPENKTLCVRESKIVTTVMGSAMAEKEKRLVAMRRAMTKLKEKEENPQRLFA